MFSMYSSKWNELVTAIKSEIFPVTCCCAVHIANRPIFPEYDVTGIILKTFLTYISLYWHLRCETFVTSLFPTSQKWNNAVDYRQSIHAMSHDSLQTVTTWFRVFHNTFLLWKNYDILICACIYKVVYINEGRGPGGPGASQGPIEGPSTLKAGLYMLTRGPHKAP